MNDPTEQSVETARDAGADEKLLARLAAYPRPEVRAAFKRELEQLHNTPASKWNV